MHGSRELPARRNDMVRRDNDGRVARETLRHLLRWRVWRALVERHIESGVVDPPQPRFRLRLRVVHALHLGERVPYDGVQRTEGGEGHVRMLCLILLAMLR